MNEQKNAIVTGATGAIGKAIAMKMAENGFSLVLPVRNESKAKPVVEEIIRQTKNSHVEYILVDLSSKSDIVNMANNYDRPVHVLINNAGTTPKSRMETEEGIEMQWAVNVLGYFWMIQNFLPHLSKAGSARIINVASYWAGGLDLNDPEFKRRSYDNDAAYRQSKQADRMLTYAFAQNLKDINITVNTCHPGDVNSTLSNDLGFGGSESPSQGAATPVWLATAEEVGQSTGCYFARFQKQSCEFTNDKQKIEKLYKLCESY